MESYKKEQNISIENSLSIANIIKNYIIPIVMALLVAGATYASINMKLDNAIKDLGVLQQKVYANEEGSEIEHSDLLNRVSKMEAKIDYIYDWVKELRTGK